MRNMLDLLAPDVLIIKETNVPPKDNFSYFGDWDEAHLIYQFPLPPLVVHTLQRGNSEALLKWAGTLRKTPKKTTYLNFLFSHDGIEIVPATGLMTKNEIDKMIEKVKKHKGIIFYKTNPDG